MALKNTGPRRRERRTPLTARAPRKPESIAEVVRFGLQRREPKAKILQRVKRHFPRARTDAKDINYYHWELRHQARRTRAA